MFLLGCNIYVLKLLTLNGLESFKGNDSPCCNMQAEWEREGVHWKLRNTVVEWANKAFWGFLLGFSLKFHPLHIRKLRDPCFVKKKVIILAAAVLMPVCGHGISGGHDVRAQTSARGKKTEWVQVSSQRALNAVLHRTSVWVNDHSEGASRDLHWHG